MRLAPLLAAFTIAAGLVGFSAATGQLPPGKGGNTQAAELARLSGDWVITKVDLPELPPDLPPPPADYLKQFTFQVRGERVTTVIRQKDYEPRTEYGLLTVDPSKSPAHVDLMDTHADFTPLRTRPTAGKSKETYPPHVTKGIYKLSGDTLVVAIGAGKNAPRPTEFKTVPLNLKLPERDQSLVAILYLTKKK
jgi:uncharacterized protein (TIGR03067 family)